MKKILIADDEECLLLAYKKLLNGPGVEIDTAQSASEAASLLKKVEYAVIIVDLRLTGSYEMEGLDIISSARTAYPQSAILVVTAYGDFRTREKVLAAGASHFLEKPVSAFQVKELLNSIGVYSNSEQLHPFGIDSP